MCTEIMPIYPVKIRKERRCHDCQRKFYKGTKMFTSVWKDDNVYRLWECADCINWISNHRTIHNELAMDESLTKGWIQACEPLPDFLTPTSND